MPTPPDGTDVSFIRPRLRVFLSVDLIGSTQFKIAQNYGGGPARSHDDPNWWPNVLGEFYTDFQKEFLRNWTEFVELCQGWSEIRIGDPPKLWKALGDELIFSKITEHVNEVWGIVQVWRKTLVDFKARWDHENLKFKSGAWIVGSPNRNWEVAFLRDPLTDDDILMMEDRVGYNFYLLNQYYDASVKRKIDIDFIGTSMDCGFRLLGKADERKFVVSADLVYLLRFSQDHCQSQSKFREKYKPIKYYFDGATELKGIDRYGVKYPVFWLDAYELSPESDAAKYAHSVDKLAKENDPVSNEEIDIFLNTYLSDVNGFPERPYVADVENGTHEPAGSLPSDHDESIGKFRNLYTSAMLKLDSLRQSATEPGTEGSSPTAEQETAIESITDLDAA
jgi:hypothetical protein